mgnify:CR=1 FL=1
MIKTLAKQIKEFKAASIATPLFMILEVLMEMIIPYLMASIIDKGVNTGDIHHIYKVGGIMVVAGHRIIRRNDGRKIRCKSIGGICKELTRGYV